MGETLRGRPRLGIPLEKIIQTVQRHGQVMAAARELRCSDSYNHQRLKMAGLSLTQVLEVPDMESPRHG
jgi:3-oxoacyl-[acyl-carrier-protein] synthase III